MVVQSSLALGGPAISLPMLLSVLLVGSQGLMVHACSVPGMGSDALLLLVPACCVFSGQVWERTLVCVALIQRLSPGLYCRLIGLLELGERDQVWATGMRRLATQQGKCGRQCPLFDCLLLYDKAAVVSSLQCCIGLRAQTY